MRAQMEDEADVAVLAVHRQAAFHAIAQGGRCGDTVIQAGDTVIGSRSKQVDTVNVVSFVPKRSS